MKKGFTLIEVIVALALIGIIAVTFIPSITFGYKNLVESQKFPKDTFHSQDVVENEIELKKNDLIDGKDSLDIFGIKVKGNKISVPVSTHGEINVFQPNYSIKYQAPELVKVRHHSIPNVVILSIKNNSTIPTEINMFNNNGTLNIAEFEVDENNFKVKTEHKNTIHLVNVYKWYISQEFGYFADKVPEEMFNNKSIIKEWNAARELVSYEDSITSNFIPNIQNNPSYNEFTFNEIKDGLSLSLEELINRYGNRYIYYSVTPYAVSGKIGEEYFSNVIYINAPKIEIISSLYKTGENTVNITFNESVDNSFVTDQMKFNEVFGKLVQIIPSETNDKVYTFEFDKTIDINTNIEDNIFNKGSVRSKKYGAISIWSNNNPNGTFTITPSK